MKNLHAPTEHSQSSMHCKRLSSSLGLDPDVTKQFSTIPMHRAKDYDIIAIPRAPMKFTLKCIPQAAEVNHAPIRESRQPCKPHPAKGRRYVFGSTNWWRGNNGEVLQNQIWTNGLKSPFDSQAEASPIPDTQTRILKTRANLPIHTCGYHCSKHSRGHRTLLELGEGRQSGSILAGLERSPLLGTQGTCTPENLRSEIPATITHSKEVI